MVTTPHGYVWKKENQWVYIYISNLISDTTLTRLGKKKTKMKLYMSSQQRPNLKLKWILISTLLYGEESQFSQQPNLIIVLLPLPLLQWHWYKSGRTHLMLGQSIFPTKLIYLVWMSWPETGFSFLFGFLPFGFLENLSLIPSPWTTENSLENMF